MFTLAPRQTNDDAPAACGLKLLGSTGACQTSKPLWANAEAVVSSSVPDASMTTISRLLAALLNLLMNGV